MADGVKVAPFNLRGNVLLICLPAQAYLGFGKYNAQALESGTCWRAITAESDPCLHLLGLVTHGKCAHAPSHTNKYHLHDDSAAVCLGFPFLLWGLLQAALNCPKLRRGRHFLV